jgi:hypothetical protein
MRSKGLRSTRSITRVRLAVFELCTTEITVPKAVVPERVRRDYSLDWNCFEVLYESTRALFCWARFANHY